LLAQVVTLAHTENTAESLAAAQCLILGFYFLLRPGKYLSYPNAATDNMFWLRDLTLWIGSRALNHMVCPPPI
jgi:hypothetical protein